MSFQEAARGGRQELAASVSTRRRQEADLQRDSLAGRRQLAAIPGETRSRPEAVQDQRQLLIGNGFGRHKLAFAARRSREQLYARDNKQRNVARTR